MDTTVKTLSNNQYYKGLNNRFDNRVKKLIKNGWVYNKGTVSFEKRSTYSSKCLSISNSEIMHSDKRHFNLILNNRK